MPHDRPATTTGVTARLPFLKHLKNIGRAYRKQAMELVACYKAFRDRIPASWSCGHRSAELRKISPAIDDALSSAARASKAASQEVDKMFDKAVRALGKYEETFYANRTTVIQRMKEAKVKDTSSVAALAVLAEKQTDDWSAQSKPVNIMLSGTLLHSKGQEVHMELDSRSSFSEMVWNLSRLRDRRRITPGQHPFFYQDLPISREEYDKDFEMYPIEDFKAVFYHNIYILVDKPGRDRVFVQSESGRKNIFGNVWMPKDTIIFKDVFGRLVGERAAGLHPRVAPDLRFWRSVDSSRAEVSPISLASIALAAHSSQPDIVTVPKAPWSIVHWRELVLRTWNSPDINVHISTSQSPSSTENRIRDRAIDILNDDVLLSIFGSYRLDDDENWNLQLRWCKLIHVCRRWRHLIYASPSHLNLHLLCTNGTPVADMLDHSPSLPLIINYPSTCATMTPDDEEGILLALQQHDRVRRVVLHAPSQFLKKVLTAMNEHFSTLERLSILSTTDDDARLVMPKTFQAPRLSHLTLLGVTLSTGPRSLASTVSLVSLALTIPRVFVYLSPEDLVAQLQFVPLLEELSICISVPIPRSRVQMNDKSMTREVLPALKRFVFRGVSAYLEGLLARISVPRLRKFDVTLFNQLIFSLPYLSHLLSVTPELRFPVANVNFNQTSVSISVSNHKEAQCDKSFCVQLSCKPFDWQVSSAAQICSALSQMLAEVEELSLDFYEHWMPPEWQKEVDSRMWMWHDLLRPFGDVKKLHVGHALASDLSRALQPEEEPKGLLLPALEELVVEEGCEGKFTEFIDARQVVDNPVQLVVCPSKRDPKPDRPRPRLPRVAYISSQPMSLDMRLPGSYPSSPIPMSRLRLPETAPISPLSAHSTSTLCLTPLMLGGLTERLFERRRESPA